MEKETIVKTIKKSYGNKIQAGIIWYRFICNINNISLTKRELQLLSYINYRGTISSASSKEEFCKLFGSSNATISNMVSKLTSLRLLEKVNSKTRVNNNLRVDFDKDFIINWKLSVQSTVELKENKETNED